MKDHDQGYREETDAEFAEQMEELNTIVNTEIAAVDKPTLERAAVAARQIHEVGLSRDNYKAVKEAMPAFLPSVNANKLTANPSETNRSVAVEALSATSMALLGGLAAGVAAGGVGFLFYKLVTWLRGRITGKGSSGSGGGGINETIKVRIPQIRIKLKPLDNQSRVSKEIEEFLDTLRSKRDSSAPAGNRSDSYVEELVTYKLYLKTLKKLVDSAAEYKPEDKTPPKWNRLLADKDITAWNILASTIKRSNAPTAKRIEIFIDTMDLYIKNKKMPYARAYLTLSARTQVGSPFVYNFPIPYEITVRLLETFTAAMQELGRAALKATPTSSVPKIGNVPKVEKDHADERNVYKKALGLMKIATNAIKDANVNAKYNSIIHESMYTPTGGLEPGYHTFIPNKHAQYFNKGVKFFDAGKSRNLSSGLSEALQKCLLQASDTKYPEALERLEKGFDPENLKELDNTISDAELLAEIKENLAQMREGMKHCVVFQRLFQQHFKALGEFGTAVESMNNSSGKL